MRRRTVSLLDAAEILGLSRSAAYRAAKAGDIKTISIGQRYLVPISWLEETIGEALDLDLDGVTHPTGRRQRPIRVVSKIGGGESRG